MPDMYPANKYDVAGFVVGAVERTSYLPRIDDIREGDVVLALPSTGVYYSLCVLCVCVLCLCVLSVYYSLCVYYSLWVYSQCG